MSHADGQINEQAAAWYLRQRDPAQADWDGFLAWLEADPEHNAAYEAVALAADDYDALARDAAPSDAPSNDNMPTPLPARRRWLAGLGGAVTIAVAGLTAYPMLTAPADLSYAVETASGERRQVTLGDGTRIELNGATRLKLRNGDSRFAELDRGEATFTVSHDPQRPFEVHAGGITLRDVGTVFNVVRTGGQTEAAVAEGAVLFNPDAEAVRLDKGRIIKISQSGTATLSKIDPSAVGAWRKGRLVYQDASFSRIAADLSRTLGEPVTLDPRLAREHFSGVIRLDGAGAPLFARIAALLDIDASRDGRGWRLSPRKHASR